MLKQVQRIEKRGQMMGRLAKAMINALAGLVIWSVLLLVGDKSDGIGWYILALPFVVGAGAWFGWTGRSVLDWWRD
jgi:hypothetical protein